MRQEAKHSLRATRAPVHQTDEREELIMKGMARFG
jgi:hypothetical protein